MIQTPSSGSSRNLLWRHHSKPPLQFPNSRTIGAMNQLAVLWMRRENSQIKEMLTNRDKAYARYFLFEEKSFEIV